MLLGIDLGTTNIKGVLLTREGSVAGSASAPVPLHTVAPDTVEQDIEEIWQALEQMLTQLSSGGGLREVQAVGISSQGAALQIVDSAYAPVGRVISWMDGRAGSWSEPLHNRFGPDWLQKNLGHAGSMLAAAQLLRLRKEQPDLVRPPYRVGFVGDCIVHRLCGCAAHDATSLSIACLLDPIRGGPCLALLEYLGIGPDRLPRLLSADRPAGVLRPGIAERFGFATDVPVLPAVHDQYAAALAAGALQDGDILLGVGTAWVLLLNAGAPYPAIWEQSFIAPHLVPGHFGHLASLNTGGVAFAWARRTLRLDHESASDIESRLASVDAGSAGVRCRPPRASGVGEASGAWMHLNLGHGPNHLLRATVESLALAVAKHLDACRAKGVTPRRLVGAGPALDSATTAQIIADATDLPLLRLRLSELSAAGAAMLACRAIQPGRNLQRIARELSPPSQTIVPGPAAAIYREMRQEVPAPTPSARRKERS